MTVAASPAAGRLQQLAAYLEQDPGNAALLAEACDEAIACGSHAQAEALIATAESLQLDPAQWMFRRSRLAIARRELGEAARCLERVRALAGDHPVLAHDLGYVQLLQDQPEACREIVEPWLQRGGEGPPEQVEALQLLWLRAMHRLQRLEEAAAWAGAQAVSGALRPRAAGAASLVALDLEEFDNARAWSDAALAADALQVEALVARGCAALAEGEPARAAQLLRQALECNPDDGRTWSALGMASLAAQDLPNARAQLERAVRTLPGHVGTWHALGWVRLLQQDREGALAAFGDALAIDRNFAETQGAIGLVLGLSGRGAESKQHLELADRLDPANVTGRYARALLAGEAGDRRALAALARRLLERRGFFGARLSDAVLRQTGAQE